AMNGIAIPIDLGVAEPASVAIGGLTVLGNGNGNVLTCGDGAGQVDLTIIDSSFSTSMKTAVSLSNCNASISETVMSNSGQVGLAINAGASYSVQNSAMVGNGTGVSFLSATGTFAFNTITNNKGTTGVA